MAYYIGPEGRIYNHPVSGGTPVGGGSVPPRPHNTPEHYTPRPPAAGEAGFFRKAFFWIFSMGGSIGMARGVAQLLTTQFFSDFGLDGIGSGVAGWLGEHTLAILCITAVIACICSGLGFGDDNMYNLAGWLLTLISTGSACLIVGAALILLPYAAALLWTFIGICIVIGVVAALLGG